MQRVFPLESIFTQSSVNMFNNLQLAAQQTPNGDWGYTDVVAAIQSGQSVPCSQCLLDSPYVRAQACNTTFTCNVAGGGPSPCTGEHPTLAQQYPALWKFQDGQDLLRCLNGSCRK